MLESFSNILIISGNSNKPDIDFNSNTGELIISGRSILENTPRFFDPLIQWLDVYLKHPAPKTKLHLKMEYFNTSTSKFLLTIIENLAEVFHDGKEVEIIWYYADEDMQELGIDYSQMISVPFSFVEYKY